VYDLSGETPYTTKEIEPDKIWEVSYRLENRSLTSKKAKEEAKGFGLDPTSESYRQKCLAAAAELGPQFVERTKLDLATAAEWFNRENATDAEALETTETNVLRMLVVRLESGALLLYAPVRMREEVGFGTWLDSLGRVEWIIVASSSHTLNIKFATERYPNAKVVGVPCSEAKLNIVEALARNNHKLDYDCSEAHQLAAANELLEKEGVKLVHIAGDVATNAIICIAHGVALECDLVYGHHDGLGFFNVDKERFQELRPVDWGLRLFRLAFMSRPNAPHGSLATYRYMMMDPAGLGAMNYDQPARDGSSCTEMAASLRALLKMDFHSAAGVHIIQQTGEDFKRNIDCNWNWLDGGSLL